MPVHNAEIAAMLEKLADLLEIEGANVFRVRAYRNAAQTVLSLSRSVTDMIAAGEDLSELPGIGEAIAAKMSEMVRTGHLGALEKEEKKLPPTLTDLLKVPGLGPKRVHLLFEQLKVSDLKELEHAARGGRIRGIKGLGVKTEQKILEHLDRKIDTGSRTLLSTAGEMVESLLRLVGSARGVRRCEAAGSFRRRVETVGDLDLLAACEAGSDVMRRFCEGDEVKDILSRGETRSTVVLRSGVQADLRAVPAESYGAALHYFTGSKAHNIAIRARGVKAGLKINEYGVFRGEERIAGETEESVFQSVGLPWIPPELREGRGEIEAADRGALPRLVDLTDIRGDLHAHTTATDGTATLEEMAAAAQARGYEYLAVTDHSKRMAMVRGLNATRLARQFRDIDKLNSRWASFRLLKSSEVDILEDGSLDFSDDILKECDVVVAVVHFRFDLSIGKQTDRILRALDNPYVNILAHPTGRLLNERDPFAVDMERVLDAARERGCCLELNAQPSRLDLNDAHCRRAKELGVPVAVSTDSHSVQELEFMRFGVGQARRGWLEPRDVLNTRPLAALLALLKRPG